MEFSKRLGMALKRAKIPSVAAANVVACLQKSDVLSRLQSHRPPVVGYIVKLVRFKKGLISGDEVKRHMRWLVARGKKEEMVITLNREIVAALVTTSPRTLQMRHF